MKSTIFAVLMLLGASANAQVCGLAEPDTITGDTAVLLVYSPTLGRYEKKTVTASTQAARELLSIFAVHGGALCGFEGPRDTPFAMCFTGDETNYVAEAVFCGKQPTCTGPFCGGNGVSVNSGIAP